MRVALRQCLREEKVSVREAAQAFGVAQSTVERWLKDGFVLPILRSRKLAPCVLSNLRLLVAVRNGRAV